MQFTITSEIADIYQEWNKENIIKRNDSMANRAVQATTSPLTRTRSIRTKNADNYSPGTYSVSDTSSPMNGSTLLAVLHDNRIISCTRWKDLLVALSSELINVDENKFRSVVTDNIIHKATSKKNYPQKDPILSLNPDLLIEPLRIQDSDYFCEGCLSNIRARIYAKQLLELFESEDDFEIEIV